MNFNHSQVETPWGLFDLPLIVIDKTLSQFENPSSDANEIMISEVMDNNKFENLANASSHKKLSSGLKTGELLSFLNQNEQIHAQSMNRKRKWDLLKNNLGQGDLSESEFEYIDKKVKDETIMVNNAFDDKVMLYDMSTDSANSPNCGYSLEQSKNTCSSNLSDAFETNYPGEVNQRISSKTSKITQVSLDGTGKLLFNVEQNSSQEQNPKSISLTRKEILSQDPLMLVYFYEKNLQFKKSHYFSGDNLEKI